MAPTAGPLASGAFEERRHARAVALHRARELLPEEATHAAGVTARRIEEGHPARIGPAPHRAAAYARRRRGVEDGNAGRVRCEKPGAASLRFDELGHRHDEVDRRVD